MSAAATKVQTIKNNGIYTTIMRTKLHVPKTLKAKSWPPGPTTRAYIKFIALSLQYKIKTPLFKMHQTQLFAKMYKDELN
jgi:hypothetical protein